MRIAARVDVAHRTVDPRGGHLEHLDAARDLDAPGTAAHDVLVVRAFDRHVGPGVEVEPVLDHGIGAAQLEHHARLDLGLVEVLRASREAVHIDEVTADGLGQRLEIGNRRDHPQLACGLGGRQRHQRGGDREENDEHTETSHHR